MFFRALGEAQASVVGDRVGSLRVLPAGESRHGLRACQGTGKDSLADVLARSGLPEPQVLNFIQRDLRQRHGGSYRVTRATSGNEALDAVRALKQRGVAIALFVVDHRTPGMMGTQFRVEAFRLLSGGPPGAAHGVCRHRCRDLSVNGHHRRRSLDPDAWARTHPISFLRDLLERSGLREWSST